MKNCENCVNYTDKKCLTMTEKPEELFCWANKEMAIQREKDIIANVMNKGHDLFHAQAARKRIAKLEKMEG